MDIEFLRNLQKENLLYFTIGSLISSDYMTDIEKCEQAKKELEEIKELLPNLVYPTIQDREKMIDLVNASIEIENEAIKRFEKENFEKTTDKCIANSIQQNNGCLGDAEPPSLETLVKALKLYYIICDCNYGGSCTNLMVEDEQHFIERAKKILEYWN